MLVMLQPMVVMSAAGQPTEPRTNLAPWLPRDSHRSFFEVRPLQLLQYRLVYIPRGKVLRWLASSSS